MVQDLSDLAEPQQGLTGSMCRSCSHGLLGLPTCKQCNMPDKTNAVFRLVYNSRSQIHGKEREHAGRTYWHDDHVSFEGKDCHDQLGQHGPGLDFT